MDRRLVLGMLCGVMAGLMVAAPSVRAEDGSAAEAAELAGNAHEIAREQILDTIEATRQTDPELAEEMERQFELYEADERAFSDVSAREATMGTSPEAAEGRPDARLIGQLSDVGLSGAGQERFDAAQSDPRMQEAHRQFEAGEIDERRAREQVFDVLRDHGIESNEGREWESMGGEQERGDFFRDARNEGRYDNEGRGWERMSTEAREQLERFSGQDGHESDSERATFERESGMPERMFEGHERESGMGGERESESPERSYESPEREVEAPTRELESPDRERELETPEAPEREWDAPEVEPEYQAPERGESGMPPQP